MVNPVKSVGSPLAVLETSVPEINVHGVDVGVAVAVGMALRMPGWKPSPFPVTPMILQPMRHRATKHPVHLARVEAEADAAVRVTRMPQTGQRVRIHQKSPRVIQTRMMMRGVGIVDAVVDCAGPERSPHHS
jgi:hypothetical protein